MDKKLCPECKILKTYSEFNKDSSRKLGIQSYCKVCQRSRDKKLYCKSEARRRDKYNDGKSSRIRNMQFVYNWYKLHPCITCGESDPRTLVFDHIQKRHKVRNISDMVARGCSINAISEEISKCQVLCSNCHAIKTAMDSSWYKNIIK